MHLPLPPKTVVRCLLLPLSHFASPEEEERESELIKGKSATEKEKKKKLIDILFLPVFICKEKGSFDLIWKT